jgi:phosphate/phosphite/phosphonate ABC transporter binding protein
VGRFDIVGRLATGGMAEIYLARETGGLDRLVVIKQILPHLAMHDAFVDMFLQEARFISRLSHPNVVQIFELGEDKGTFFIAMEYVPGASLRELMRSAALSDRPIPLDVAISLMVQACAGSHAAHELTDPDGKPLGLVHRDISPHNLMVTRAGHVKLLDFGIAKATEIAAEHTRTGALKGKVHYMSPEQCRQQALDRRSDVFALGIVLWELITARRLFKRESDLDSMQAIVTGDRWDVREFRDDVPASVAKAIDKAICTDADERYKSADEMRRALLGCAEAEGLAIGEDTLAPFVEDLLGPKLDVAKQALDNAIEATLAEGSLSNDEATLVDRAKAHRASGIHDAETLIEGVAREGTATGETNVAPVPSAEAPVQKKKRPMAALFGLFVVATALLAAFFIFRPLGPGVSGKPLIVGYAPTIDPAVLRAEMEPLREYLERSTKRPVEMVMANSYGDLAERLIRGEIHFGQFPPNLYVQTKMRAPKIEPLVYKLYEGSRVSDGYLMAREGAEISRIEDLKGKVFCYPDEQSTTGYRLPRAAMRRVGIDPDKDLAGKVRSGNHSQVLRDLVAGRCDAGGTFNGAYVSAQNQGIPVGQLRMIQSTGRVPQDSMTAGPTTSDKERKLVREALLAFDVQRELGRDHLGKVERITGFAKGSDDDYSSLRELLANEQAHGQ